MGLVNTVTATTLTMIDDDKLTRNLKLRFDPAPVSREAEGTDVEVTLYVDGSRFASRHSFDIVYKNTVGDARNDLFDQTPNTQEVILDSTRREHRRHGGSERRCPSARFAVSGGYG